MKATPKRGSVLSEWRQEVLDKLHAYSGFSVETHETGVAVRCQNADSFEVSVFYLGEAYQVNFVGWHEHFDALADALNCFAFGLSEECRLKVLTRGRMDCSWTVQSMEDGEWVDDSTTGLLIVPFWRPVRTRYLQNKLEKLGQ